MEQYISAWTFTQQHLGAFFFPWGIGVMAFLALVLIALAWHFARKVEA